MQRADVKPDSWTALFRDRKRPADSIVPLRFPSDISSIVDLDDDRPSAAALVYAPAPSCGDGWNRENLLFLGTDGRWRHLNMASLGLPARAWGYGCDTYGAGALSPDGRWWATRAQDRIVLLEVSSGRMKSRSIPGGAQTIEWNAAGTELLTFSRTGVGRLFQTPTLRMAPVRFSLDESDNVVMAPQSGYFELAGVRDVGATSSSGVLRTFDREGTLVREQEAPPGLLTRRSIIAGVSENRLAIWSPQGAGGEVTIVDLELSVIARLTHAPYGGTGWANDGGVWLFADGAQGFGWNIDDHTIQVMSPDPGPKPDDALYSTPTVAFAADVGP